MNDSHHWDERRTASRAAARLAAKAERGGDTEPSPGPAPGDAEPPAAASTLPARGSLFRPLSLWPDPRHAPPRHARR